MGIFLFLIIYILVSIGLIWACKMVEARMCYYDTRFCRDVRAQLGMFAYRSKLEASRKYLNNDKTKF